MRNVCVNVCVGFDVGFNVIESCAIDLSFLETIILDPIIDLSDDSTRLSDVAICHLIISPSDNILMQGMWGQPNGSFYRTCPPTTPG